MTLEIRIEFIFAFIIYWSITDRFRETTLFWKSRFKNPWWNSHNNPGHPWNPFRDAYHFFKNAPILTFSIGMIIYGVLGDNSSHVSHGLQCGTIWAMAQWLGKEVATKDEKNIY